MAAFQITDSKEEATMDPDPMQYVEDPDKEENKDKADAASAKARLNTLVAISVALLATFMGICKVKDDNIVQAMQQAQANKIDSYSWYQARNIREEVARATVAQLTVQAASAPTQAAAYQEQIKTYQAIAQEQAEKKRTQQAEAEQADKTYNELNYHDDQFDLSDAMIALAISLLALTALTQKRWLFVVAMAPTFLGVVMGLAGLFGWQIHSDFLARLLS
jgi:ribosomal protein S13